MHTKNYEVDANYKLIGENFMEYYHLPWVHSELVNVSKMEDHYRWQRPGMYTGMCTTPVSQNTEDGGWEGLPPIGSLDNEAAQIANDSSYGLAGGIFTKDIDRAIRFANEVEAGYVMINEYFTGCMGSPFGGYKQSGIGREKGLVALDNYTQIKNVVLRVR